MNFRNQIHIDWTFFLKKKKIIKYNPQRISDNNRNVVYARGIYIYRTGIAIIIIIIIIIICRGRRTGKRNDCYFVRDRGFFTPKRDRPNWKWLRIRDDGPRRAHNTLPAPRCRTRTYYLPKYTSTKRYRPRVISNFASRHTHEFSDRFRPTIRRAPDAENPRLTANTVMCCVPSKTTLLTTVSYLLRAPARCRNGLVNLAVCLSVLSELTFYRKRARTARV